jgi:cullin-associated NEDD8-dissociated protein 1
LLCLGEIGRLSDHEYFSKIREAVLMILKQSQNDFKWAASIALGNIYSGKCKTQISELLKIFVENSIDSFLWLNSLKHLLAREGAFISSSPDFAQVLTIIYQNMEQNDEALRNVVSECLGILISHNPDLMISEIMQKISSSNTSIRSCAVASLRSVTFFNEKVALWKDNIPKLLDLSLNDEDLVSDSS